MSGRRAGNRIRGPQSALTDFLAANNISAAQIRDDYERRRREQAQSESSADASRAQSTAGADEEVEAAIAADIAEEAEKVEKSKKRKRVAEEAKEKAKKAKASSSKKGGKKKKRDDSDDDSDDDFDGDFMRDQYKKARPAHGQFEHCDICNKRFTVTPYSKEGPDGGLLCTPCGKQMASDLKREEKASQPKPAGRKRRKIESDRLDGRAVGGAKTLQQLCLATIAQHHDDIESLRGMPQFLLERLSMVFSKKRVLKPKTLPLFLNPEHDAVVLHDAAYLEEDDYHHVFAMSPKIEKLVLGNACQLKDKAIDYMLEKCPNIKWLQLYAANLVSDSMWLRLFREAGHTLEAVKLTSLDSAFDDLAVRDMVKYSPNLQRIKLKDCRRIGPESVQAISELQHLEHLSLKQSRDVSVEILVDLIQKRGSTLRTLSLEKFFDADDSLLQALHSHCLQLSKLRFTENDTATDAGFVALFTKWQNSPLTFVDLHSNRDVDNNNPDGPEEAIGLASEGFKALMAHSGDEIKHLDISSCRHIQLSAFMDVFNGGQAYPDLEEINISFCNKVDNSVIAGIFKSCPKLKKLDAFGCFDVMDIVVPRNVTLVGVPRAQDAIEQFGVGIDVEEAISRMVEMGA
ncbi:DNA repair protein rhp7 [Pseudocercospora fuligena]|uniref:DNA repair protein rhp7 n=1 Tax=Pseudocercospora fuligena TaxID=685502 RepID=A0A8H6RC34_9PEZI|nr:DNA repair protein rhp7 [Pseudocercospora fuligena]